MGRRGVKGVPWTWRWTSWPLIYTFNLNVRRKNVSYVLISYICQEISKRKWNKNCSSRDDVFGRDVGPLNGGAGAGGLSRCSRTCCWIISPPEMLVHCVVRSRCSLENDASKVRFRARKNGTSGRSWSTKFSGLIDLPLNYLG